MSYRIQYGIGNKYHRLHNKVSGKGSLVGLFLMACLVLCCIFWESTKSVLVDLLIPGDEAVTVAAFENMAVRLKSGEGIIESFRSFCHDILTGAGF